MRKLFWLLMVGHFSFAGDPYPKNESIDIQHYLFELQLNDRDDRIEGRATVTILFRQRSDQVILDLVQVNNEGKGMVVSQVMSEGIPLSFHHDHDRLGISLQGGAPAGSIKTVTITYSGVPQDGLIISANKFGDRTYFGDNWPDRAHHWLPTIDHPYDKAMCDFVVTAPEQYQVVANGEQIEETNLPGNQKLTHWQERTPISTKLMVIGVARFAMEKSGQVGDIPVETWVFPQNREAGFLDFATAENVLAYFQSSIGPFAYEKLANVQSKTRYGGMENASCIFYFENSVTGHNERENLIAHEVAHQWFGDATTEQDWFEVWLSEGFATYFADLYLENKYGEHRFQQELQEQRAKVIEYFQKSPSSVIDTALTDIRKVLNTNSYQKGAWVLHMLRSEVGDSAFWEGIRQYYATYKNRNAWTIDFQHMMEKTSGQDLTGFFRQWLYQKGYPEIRGKWNYNSSRHELTVEVSQTQKELFRFPLEIAIQAQNGGIQEEKVVITGQKSTFSFPVAGKPQAVLLDPNTRLLYVGNLTTK